MKHWFWKALLLTTTYNSFGAAYEASEAHKHAHELACVLEYEELCRFHRD